MKRTTTNAGRGARSTGWTFGPHMDTDVAQAERDAEAGAATAKATIARADERIVHPVIESSGRRCYRVIRLFLNQGHLSIEDIGECRTEAEALAVQIRERWRAQTLDPNGRMYSDNWREMERRS